MSRFVKEEVVTKRVLMERENGCGPEGIYMSVKREDPINGITLVIGAKYENRSACFLSKNGLAALIEELKLIHEVL